MLISIYPLIRGEHRELRADADMKATGPFDSPDAISGRIVEVPAEEDWEGIGAGEVLIDGEVYRFQSLSEDGSFELRKAW